MLEKRLRYSILIIMDKNNIVFQIRNKFNISQEELAHVLGVSYTSVNAWEGGKRIPQEQMLTVLKDILNSDELPTIGINAKSPKGLFRTDAGYVSSIIDYNNMRDHLPYTHNIGRWYGSLPSFLVRDLLKFIRTDFSKTGPVLANFSGSGTVALEAALSGMTCYATDINPMAIALSTLKTHPTKTLTISDLEKAFNYITQNKTILLADSASTKDNIIIGENRWLSDKARVSIQELCSGISLLEDYDLKLLFTVALASIVINFCNIDKRCTNHYVFKNNSDFSRHNLEKALWDEVFEYKTAISRLDDVPNYCRPEIMYGNACSLTFKDKSMGIVFSHPPYGTTINYYSINRIPISIIELVKFNNTPQLLNATDCKKNDLSSGTLSRFNSFTECWVSEAYRVLRPGGIFVSIIGDSRNNGKLSHPFTDMISYGESHGFIMKEIFIWVTNHKSGMHVKRKGNHIDHNYVIIMEKKDETN